MKEKEENLLWCMGTCECCGKRYESSGIKDYDAGSFCSKECSDIANDV